MAIERVQKILAKAGISSRRKAEEMITLGEVTINGKVAKLGDKAEMGKDSIKVKGKLLLAAEAPVYLSFYKPKNVISSLADPEGRPTLGEYLKRIEARVYPVGRLDFTSEGLILLTNDGDLAEKLQKRDDIPRVYHVKLKGHPDREMLARLERGGKIGHKFVKPHSVRLARELANKSMVEIVIMGGGAVDIKEFVETRGFLVERIVRVAFGHLTIAGMTPGQFEYLKPTSVNALIEQPELGLKRLEKVAEDSTDLLARREEREAREIVREERRSGAGAERKPAIIVAASKSPAASSSTGGGVRRRGAAPAAGSRRGARSEDLAGEFESKFGEKRGFGEKRSFGEKRGFGEKRSFSRDRSEGAGGSDRPRRSEGGFKKSFGRFEDGGAPKRSSGGFRKSEGRFGGDRDRAPRAAGGAAGSSWGSDRPRSRPMGDRPRPMSSDRPKSNWGANQGGIKPSRVGRRDDPAQRDDRPSFGRGKPSFRGAKPSFGGAGRRGGADRPRRGPSGPSSRIVRKGSGPR